jgi:hypothetical protein
MNDPRRGVAAALAQGVVATAMVSLAATSLFCVIAAVRSDATDATLGTTNATAATAKAVVGNFTATSLAFVLNAIVCAIAAWQYRMIYATRFVMDSSEMLEYVKDPNAESKVWFSRFLDWTLTLPLLGLELAVVINSYVDETKVVDATKIDTVLLPVLLLITIGLSFGFHFFVWTADAEDMGWQSRALSFVLACVPFAFAIGEVLETTNQTGLAWSTEGEIQREWTNIFLVAWCVYVLLYIFNAWSTRPDRSEMTEIGFSALDTFSKVGPAMLLLFKATRQV